MLQFGFDPSILRGRRVFQIPEGVGIVRDPSAGQWIESRLQPWGSDGVTLRSFLPDTFPAYARIFHPFYLGNDEAIDRDQDQPVRWSTIAHRTGATVHSLMQVGNVAKVPYPYRFEMGDCPEMGSLPVPETIILTGLLRDFTTTPDKCYLGYWEGYGCLNGGRIYFFDPDGGWLSRVESMVHNLWENLRPATDLLVDAPRLKGQERDYILFHGSLETVPSLSQYPPWGQSPSLWWPEDRTWCVATEIDGYDTFVGGSEACIERILNCPDLEALPFSIDGRIDGEADLVNT